MTVPIVSKKSVSMIAKIVRTAANGPRTVKTLVRSNWPSVAKLGVTEIVVRHLRDAGEERDDGDDEDRDDQGAADLPDEQDDGEQQADQEHELAGRGREDRGHDRRAALAAWR